MSKVIIKNKFATSDYEILDKYINHEITNIEAAKLIGVSRGTFFRLSKTRKMSEHRKNFPTT